jgi:7,8-dihydro-6-hydroxymethylpterin-pyrophosphokinase
MAREAIRNLEFDLVSVIYNASQAVETCSQYIKDAEGDQEVERFFNQVININSELVQQGKQLLKSRL